MSKSKKWLIAFLLASTLGGEASYKLVKTIPVPGEGGFWDYLYADTPNRRLYVSHGTEVNVLNLDTHEIVGKIPNTNGVHGIAVADSLNRGFISDGRDNQVTIFDLRTLATIRTVKTGTNPDGILFDAYSNRVFTFNGRSHDVTALSAETGDVVGTVPLGGKPEFPASDSKGNAYVNLEDQNQLVRFDPRTLEIKNRWPLAPCESPSGLAIDIVGRRLFSVCENKIMAVVDADNGKVITTLPTGAGTDAAAFDPEKKLAFASNGRDATLTVIQQSSNDSYHVVQNVKTSPGARTMAVDLKTHTVYLSDADFGETPAPTADVPHPRPKIIPGTFKLLVVSNGDDSR
ncbi:MAG: PQQ-binding-like beta-propeller repeat protein [Acidobacteriaceae bacterium]|nr:PQQ-binding-like beta-propeller repeat protein [Acidobacteriaceae bacterium]